MALANLQLYSQQSNGVTYALPEDPDCTVRFKTSSSPKTLDGKRVINYVTEITMNDSHSLTLGDDVVDDALSVRLRVSGSAESMDRLEEMVDNLSSKLDAWISENVLLGFQPTTVPVSGSA
jgi:ubiquinone biosynthesis protein UbiJ